MRKLLGTPKALSWAFYDWANSTFATTVMAGFFPLFFQLFWSKGADPTVTTIKLGTTISIASFVIAILAPFLGALADLKGVKKKFLFVFCLGGALFTGVLGFIPEGAWFFAAVAYGLAMMGYTGSVVFYDSLLPSVADGKEDEVSALGFGLGYLGGGILFALNILMYQKFELFGFASGSDGIQASFVTVSIWWLAFSIPLFLWVPEPKTALSKIPLSFGRAFSSAFSTLLKIKKNKNLFLFMIAYWLYIDGVYTVITMAINHGSALGLKPAALITALLVTQFVGFPFAILFGKLAGPFGCRKPILAAIGVYILVVIYATQIQTETEFLLLAVAIGMVQGGVQALSRSFFAKIIPAELSAEYYGFFNLVGKFASVLGPSIVVLGALLTNSTRYGILGLLILFFVGGGLLLFVKEEARA